MIIWHDIWLSRCHRASHVRKSGKKRLQPSRSTAPHRLHLTASSACKGGNKTCWRVLLELCSATSWRFADITSCFSEVCPVCLFIVESTARVVDKMTQLSAELHVLETAIYVVYSELKLSHPLLIFDGHNGGCMPHVQTNPKHGWLMLVGYSYPRTYITISLSHNITPCPRRIHNYPGLSITVIQLPQVVSWGTNDGHHGQASVVDLGSQTLLFLLGILGVKHGETHCCNLETRGAVRRERSYHLVMINIAMV